MADRPQNPSPARSFGMNDDNSETHARFLASLQPVVLVGGKSRRFGRDKLREPLGSSELLVQRPINALRQVFGSRVKLVGECHPSILPLADGVIPDEYPGIGPMGGIVSALKHSGGPIAVLAGDMPGAAPEWIIRLIRDAEAASRGTTVQGPLAVLALSATPNPCAGVYFPDSRPFLEACIKRNSYRLNDALPIGRIALVHVGCRAVENLNTAEDLLRFQAGDSE